MAICSKYLLFIKRDLPGKVISTEVKDTQYTLKAVEIFPKIASFCHISTLYLTKSLNPHANTGLSVAGTLLIRKPVPLDPAKLSWFSD